MERDTNLKSIKNKLLDYVEQNKLGKDIKEIIEECNNEKSLQMCLNILKRKGELDAMQISYIILTD